MEANSVRRLEYVQKLLDAYRRTPGTTGILRPADRRLAAQLHQQGVSLTTVENAFVLAAARRLFRPTTVPPLPTVRSLAYFLPVIEEVLVLKVSDDYFQHLRHRLQNLHSV